LLADQGIVRSTRRAGNVRDKSAMESFVPSMTTEGVYRKAYRIRGEARVDVFDYIERFYNPRRRNSTPNYDGPIAFETKTAVA
jgi:putative transposase